MKFRNEISKSVSEAKIKPVTPLSHRLNAVKSIILSSNTKQAQNEHNFITLGKITEPEKIEIIKRGFQLQNEGKIALKKYYETTQEYSLFQFKGYNIKYERKLSQQLNPSNN